METADPQPEPEAPLDHGRARRAFAIIATSVAVIALTGIAYVHPSLSIPSAPSPRPSPQAGYQLLSVDFATPTTGWMVAGLAGGGYAVMGTTDAGRTWTRDLAGPGNGRGTYLDFFDARDGIFALTGARTVVYRTRDGGRTWSSQVPLGGRADVLSVSFVDPRDGWLLVSAGSAAAPTADLYRTSDGGATWTDLSSPTLTADQPYRVQFAGLDEGWLDSVNAGPYAYRSRDAGATWTRVPLPAPPGGWPANGQFFVGARPTRGLGVVATVVNFPPIEGRHGVGAAVLVYPPLTVRAFDGGVPVTFTYATFIDTVASFGSVDITGTTLPITQSPAPNQVELGSLDGGATWTAIVPPTAAGAVGYSNAQDWWWIGSGDWATSSNGGTTWTPYRNLGVIAPLPGSLQVLDAGHAWFAAMAGWRPVLETTADGGVHWRALILPPI
ncbi:MAG: hypothetical protein WCC30_17415 [Candidatus Dormiibacterota bacterium]